MKLAATYASAEAFRAHWPKCVDALSRLCEGPLAPPDDRYSMARAMIEDTRDRPEVAGIEQALGKLWAFDERFFGDVIGGGEPDFRWAVYCSAYLIDDPHIAADLLDVYCPLLGTFAIETFGETFVRKVCSTFRGDVSEVIWEHQELEAPRHESEFFDWHGQLNGSPDNVRTALIAQAGIPPLEHESLPPLDVMRVFSPQVSSPARLGASADEYLRDLARFYEQHGYTDVSKELYDLEKRRSRMTDGTLFSNLTSDAIARVIRTAEHSVCFAAPGIQIEPAKAMAEVAGRIGPELITVCLDFDERVMRMGFGDLAAVKALQGAGISVNSTPGLRTGLVIVDHNGYIFTPTALYLEAEDRPAEAPNAMRLSKDQVTEALARLSPAAKAIAIAMAKTDEEREHIRSTAVEVRSQQVVATTVEQVERRLTEAPPVRFDVARQVRVFNAYLQYVDLKLEGAAIQRHRVAIPPNIQKLGGAKDLEGRLKTTFDLIEKGGKLSSKALEDSLNEIRKNFTPSLGKDHGRVVLKAAKPHLEEKLKAFRTELEKHQETVKTELQDKLNESRKQIVDYYAPIVVKNPPDAMRGQFLKFEEPEARIWLDHELDRAFPKAEALIQKMQLDVRYKDVTFETLNREDFLAAIEKAFPGVDWDKAYSEFRAAGEDQEHQS